MSENASCSGCASPQLRWHVTVSGDGWQCRQCGRHHQGWLRRRLGPVSVAAAAQERTPCGHRADLLLSVAGRRLAVERDVADLALRALATAVPLTGLCPGGPSQVGSARWDPAYGPLLFRGEPSGSGARGAAEVGTGERWTPGRVQDPATLAGVELVGGPGWLAWPSADTDVVVAAWRTPPGWHVTGLPDLTGRTTRRVDPDVQVAASPPLAASARGGRDG